MRSKRTDIVTARRAEFMLAAKRHFVDKDEIEVIERAPDLAIKAHEGDYRKNGEPYVIHPMAVAEYLIDLQCDLATVRAALFQGVVMARRAELIEAARRRFVGEDQIEVFVRALDFAIKAHEGDYRKTGEPYILHPMEVTEYLLAHHCDLPTAVAGILHDVVEDTAVPLREIRKIFGEVVAQLVDGVTKIRDDKAMTIQKLNSFSDLDMRVWLIKGADRAQNLETIDIHKNPVKIYTILQETINCYVPSVRRMGFSSFAWQLEHLATKAKRRLLEKVAFSHDAIYEELELSQEDQWEVEAIFEGYPFAYNGV